MALATPVVGPGAGVGTPEVNRQTDHHANVGRELKAQADYPERPSHTNLQVRPQKMFLVECAIEIHVNSKFVMTISTAETACA